MIKLLNTLKEKYIYLIYILVAILFIYQHTLGIGWDFASYTLNAKYFFSSGTYFEWLRPPLAPFLMGMLSIFTWKLAPYFYIIFLVTLHFYSSLILAKKFNIDPNIYYIISLSPFFLIYSLREGTEILSLSLLQLFLAYLNNKGSGIFLALAFLTRYPNIIFLPLILFKKNIKKILFELILFILILSPWLLYNYALTGNALTSIADAYALNIKFRLEYINFNFNILDIILFGNYLLIFTLLYFLKNSKNLNKKDFIMLIFLALFLISYLRTPIKVFRYLFLILIPLAYFSAKYLEKLKNKFKIALILLLISIIIFIFSFTLNNDLENFNLEKQAKNNLDNCNLMSNRWVPMNYIGVTSLPAPRKELLQYYINKGNRILIFYKSDEPDYSTDMKFLENFNVIKKTDSYILLGDRQKCSKPLEKFELNYLSSLNETVYLLKNETIDISNCNILFNDKMPLLCKSKSI